MLVSVKGKMDKDLVKKIGAEHGILVLGVVRLGEEPEFPSFASWLAEGIPPYLGYLNNYHEIRKDPRLLLDDAKSAIICAVSYELSVNSFEPRVAGYANAPDYHRWLKKQMTQFFRAMQIRFPSLASASARALVDSAPILERALAARTEFGFIGKNTCYIHPKFGSNLLLGELLIDKALDADSSSGVDPKLRGAEGGCGTCRRCQVHCPTGALNEDYKIAADKCLSYWTIENRGTVPFDYWPHFAKFWYGCDICQNVCPYNRGEMPDSAPPLPRKFAKIDLAEVATMDQAFYERVFGGSPMVRAKIDGLKRNALIALVVTGDLRLQAVIKKLLSEPLHDVVAQTIAQIPLFLSREATECRI